MFHPHKMNNNDKTGHQYHCGDLAPSDVWDGMGCTAVPARYSTIFSTLSVSDLLSFCMSMFQPVHVSLQEEFCFPVECLSLTVEEVMHIRQVLVKAELEKFQQYKDVYNAMKKGKVFV